MNQLARFLSRRFAIVLLLIFSSISVHAQMSVAKVFHVKSTIEDYNNMRFLMLYLSDSDILTYNNFSISSSGGFSSFAINPTTFSLAAIKNGKLVEVCSCYEFDYSLARLTDKRKGLPSKPRPVSLCYSSDAKELLVSNTLGEIIVYSTQDYLPKYYLEGEKIYNSLAISPNSYLVAATSGNEVDIWNYSSREIRKNISFPSAVTGVAFSADSRLMAVTYGKEGMKIIDTRTLEETKSFSEIGSLSSPVFHPEGKYLAVVRNANSFAIFNLITGRIEQEVTSFPGKDGEPVPLNGLKKLGFIKSKNVLIIGNSSKELIMWDASSLDPFYTQIVGDEVGKMMNDWVRQMEGESMEDYAVRVNDETRALQEALFTEEIATNIAKDRVSLKDPFMGDFNAETNLLDIGFASIAPIAIAVTAEEASTFGKDNLSFENAIYVLNDNDEFEIAYLEVVNETTNKRYVYNNLKRTSLTNVFDQEEKPDFIPLEIIQEVSMTEIKLEEKKDEVVEEKKKDNFITDNTQITMNSSAVVDYDANGNKIFNYQLAYEYNVFRDFYAKEDFPSAKYMMSQSNAATSMLQIIKEAFSGDLSQYIKEGKQIVISITGTADGEPINKIPYYELYGSFVNEPCYVNGELENITVTRSTGITQNSQLAIIRAAGFKHHMEKEIPELKKAQCKFILKGNVVAEEGGEHRRITVEITIKDAFNN